MRCDEMRSDERIGEETPCSVDDPQAKFSIQLQ